MFFSLFGFVFSDKKWSVLFFDVASFGVLPSQEILDFVDTQFPNLLMTVGTSVFVDFPVHYMVGCKAATISIVVHAYDVFAVGFC